MISPTINIYTYTEKENLKILRFKKIIDEWLDVIAKCINGSVRDFDIVEGPMAGNAIWNYVQDYISGDITREAL